MGFYRTMSVVVSGCVLAGVAWTFSARDAGRRLLCDCSARCFFITSCATRIFSVPLTVFCALLPSNCGRLASRVSLSPHISCFHHQVKSLVKTFDFVGTIRKHGRDIGFTQVFRHY